MNSLDQKRRFLHNLGLVQRAGGLVSGADASARKLERGDGVVILLAEGSGHSVRRRFKRLSTALEVPLCHLDGIDKVELGKAIGRPPRSVVVVLRQDVAAMLEPYCPPAVQGRESIRNGGNALGQ